ncbi:insecticidal delta-endotoxin Cry8Ea1 family protein [Bacillus cereus]|uniref:insecticidal delta-endotoxin Cry8Ea1 family protein n=1 Tax=Bacillus cereus TaxID=1396 RepID=UPI003012F502
MNPNNNHEYKIIDTNSSFYPPNYSKYPFANNPNQPLQYNNYKDSFNELSKNYPLACTPSSLNWSAATSAALIVTGTLLAAIFSGGLGLLIPVTTAGIISIGTMLPLFWSDKAPDINQVWKDFISQGSSINKRDITSAIETIVFTELNSLRDKYEFYLRALNNWKNNRNKPEAKDEVKEAFRTLHKDCVGAMAKFSPSNYEVILLSFYASAASLHIILLHEGIQYAEEWELDRAYKIFYSDELTLHINKYIDHCEYWYRKGLEQLRLHPNINWDAFNNYRSEYTISVLKVISTFPRFDLRYYPTNIAVQMESTQKLYTTTPEIPGVETPAEIDYIEKELIPPLDLFKQLHTLNLYTFIHPINLYNYLQGIQNRSYYTNTTINTDSNYGTRTGPSYTIGLNILNNSESIYYSNIYHHSFPSGNILTGDFGIRNIEFDVVNNKNETSRKSYNTYATNDVIVKTTLPFKPEVYNTTNKNYDYILSLITMTSRELIGCASRTYLYGFIWTDSNVNLNNIIHSTKEVTISERETKIVPHITQISAVKAFTKSSNALVIEGPGHTGSDLIKFKNIYDAISTIYRFTDSARYKMRIRYASESAETSLTMTILYSEGGPKEIPITLRTTPDTVLDSNTVINPKYKNFHYVDVDEIILINKSPNNPYVALQINLMSREIQSKVTFIDKIEFIPIT